MKEYLKDNQIALERQIRLILSTFKNVTENSDGYNFRCPICGDSKKSKSKKRCYILKSQTPFMIYCHNCFYKKPVVFWLKEFYPSYYKDYIKELFQNERTQPLPKIENLKNKKEFEEKDHTKFFVPIKKGMTSSFAKAIRLCIDRKIPENIWSTWYVATGGMYNNRMIIPFFDNNGKIYYYQGRRLYDYIQPKYLSRKGDFNNIYNYFLVDRNKPVIVLEGPIDSIFVDNSIALTGVKTEDKKLSEFPHKRYLIDFDATKETREKTRKLLSEGNYVFCWKKFMKIFNLPMKEKWDINDVIIYLNRGRFTYEELQPYFTNSIYDKVFFI